MSKVKNTLMNLDTYLAMLAFCLMQTSVFIQVFVRYVFDIPLSWPEEVARYSLVWLTFMGASAAVRANDHIRIDVLLVSVSPATRARLIIWTNICTVVVLIAVVPAGIRLVAMMMGIPTAALQVSMSWVYLPVPLCLTLVAAQLVTGTIAEIKSLRKSGQKG